MKRQHHIHIRDLGVASESFEAPGGGSTKRPTPVADRRAHAGRLRGDLVRLYNEIDSNVAAQADLGVPEKKRGRAMSLLGRAGQELNVGSAGVDSRATSLFTVKRFNGSSNQGAKDQATLFVTARGFETLLGKLDEYEAWDDQNPDKKRPRNFWLFESVDTIRAATLEDFWNDAYSNFPRGGTSVEWEVWTRHSLDDAFLRAVTAMELEIRGGVTRFIDTDVRNVVATRRQLQRLINSSAAVVELRGASSFVADDSASPNQARRNRASQIATRIVPANRSAPLVTILDTGVNRSNPLLTASLPTSRCHVAAAGWDPFDPDGHGTKMAGIALFGDLDAAITSSGPILPGVALESVTVAAPNSAIKLPARDALRSAVNIVEQLPRRRVFCLAATAQGEAEDGRPTSTSSTLDQLAFGDGVATRLFCAAVGNVPTNALNPYQVSQYEALNEDHGIQSPAQAMNALSVAAATHKCSTTALVAPLGDLSPTSRTAQAWEVSHPHKPDIVMEGGNHIIDPASATSRPHVPDMVTTTSRHVENRPITVTGETSAATAAAARLAALTAARYPEMRPETIRGLLTHSARWTDAMRARHANFVAAGLWPQDAWSQVLACYGWGIPDEERLFWSADNALTLIVEDTLRPYQRSASSITLKEMKYFRLPWPDGALEALGNTQVELRATLSYFIEPDPNSASRDRLDRYPSHRLKFDFKRFGESDEQAQSRFNRAVAGDGEDGDDSGWLLGPRLKSRGTLHQDIWNGPAYMLEGRNGVSVAPIRGWWGDRPAMHPEDRAVPFSLIVSITTPAVEADLYTEALARVPAGRLVVPASVNRR